MTKESSKSLEFLAEDIKAIGNNIRFNLAIQLHNTTVLVDKYLISQTRKYGKKRSRMETLITLTIHGGILRPSDISKLLFRSKQTVTHIINSLEKERLVKRELLGKDRRTRRVIITKKGLSVVKESLPATLEIFNSAMPELDKEEIQTFTGFLRRVRKHLYGKTPI